MEHKLVQNHQLDLPFVLMVHLVCQASLVLGHLPEPLGNVNDHILLGPVVSNLVAAGPIHLRSINLYSIIKCNYLPCCKCFYSKQSFTSITKILQSD